MPSTAHPVAPSGALARLARTITRRPRLVLLAWIVALGVAFGLSSVAGGEWSSDYSTPGSGSKAAQQLLADRFDLASVDTIDVVWHTDAGAMKPNTLREIEVIGQRAKTLEGIARSGPAAAGAQVSPDGRTALLSLPLDRRSELVPNATATTLIGLAKEASGDGLTVAVGGAAIQRAEAGGLPGETIGLTIAAIVLLLAVGSVVAAGLPLVTAIFGIGASVLLIASLSAVVSIPDWGLSVAAMIGLGVGIDYALLLLMRFRAARGAGLDVTDSVVEAVTTAGRSVLVAGTTVMISLLGLFLMGLTYLYGVALATIIAVLVVMAGALTLMPALLAMLGTRVDALRLPGLSKGATSGEGAGARRWALAVQRRPWPAAVTGIAVIAVITAPVAGMRLGFPDASNDAKGTMNRTAYDLTSAGFGAGASGPLLIVADGASGIEAGAMDRISTALRRDRGVANVSEIQRSPDGSAALLSVIPRTGPQTTATRDLIDRVRDGLVPVAIRDAQVDVFVGGFTAATVDQSAVTAKRLPLFIGSVVLLSMLLLLVSFRSLPIAIKAAVLNLLSIAAAYGVVALVAQGGVIGGLFGVDAATPVPPYIPVMLFAILFGLSMDYEVFLVSRMREAYLGGATAHEAVTTGLASTARVITAAAAIMIAVFGAFAVGDDVGLKMIGVGLATAVFVDATIVRMLLVPAVLQLLGERAWWIPKSVDRALPSFALEAPAVESAR